MNGDANFSLGPRFGRQPCKAIGIRFSGLKQGEKLDEELVEDAGHCDESEHPSILIVRPARRRWSKK